MSKSEAYPSVFMFPRPMDGKIITLAAVALLLTSPLRAADTTATAEAGTNASLASLSGMSIEQLMNVKVSILGPSQSVSKSPAAVSVITADDIKRSGAQNIPEALRLVPGLDVAQIDSAQWAVSIRGFNSEFANKLLVLEDGRSLYEPLFGGVAWDAQDTMMDNIDHIEVVRGPGATLWGANAVNGVINIITKSAQDTQGWLVSGGGGNQTPGFGSARYGGKIGENAYYRVYGTYTAHDPTELPGGSDAENAWQMGRGGFRADWTPPGDNLFTLQGDGYWGDVHELFTVYDPASPSLSGPAQDDMGLSGANTLARWTHTISDTADFKLQAYYDYTERDATQVFGEKRHTADLNFQNEFALGDRHKLIWGLGYRATTDTEQNNPTYTFSPAGKTVNLYSAFLQDEIALLPDRLSLTLGSKIEHNDFTGVEVEPGARLLWTPWVDSGSRALASQNFWASVSRAVRTPTRADEDIILHQAGPPPFAATINGNTGFESEELLAYEIGWRAAPVENVSLDAAAFYNDYNHLRNTEVSSISFFPPPPTINTYLANNMAGDTYGAEVSATWRATDYWRLQPAYTFLKMNLHVPSTSTDTVSAPTAEGESPENQFSLRSLLDLPHGVTFDAALRYVDSLSALQIPSYFELDARLAWQINPHCEFALVGQNLLHPQHPEFAPTDVHYQATQIPRSVYGEITLRF